MGWEGRTESPRDRRLRANAERRVTPYSGEHPHPFLRARRYMGRQPASYVALALLRERGGMPQAEFMDAYHAAGAARLGSGARGSFLNNFRRFVYHSGWICIRVVTSQRWDRSSQSWVRVTTGAPRNGNMLYWCGPEHVEPDWRPSEVIPEDHYAA